MNRIPKWAQAVILLAIIAGTAFSLYYKFVLNSPEKSRDRQKQLWDSRMAANTTKELREKGKQKAGLSDYVVEATCDKGNDYKNATIRKSTGDGKVVEEIKASRMTVTSANADEFVVDVFDATRTTYDEAGKTNTESMPGRKNLVLYRLQTNPEPQQ
jgi:hypothetical protein